jgi:hypothetical protein
MRRRVTPDFSFFLPSRTSMIFDDLRPLILTSAIREAEPMVPMTRAATDLVEEFVLRRWAREHHVPVSLRDSDWHPVVLDEMDQRDRELAEATVFSSAGGRIVPLVPETDHALHGPHHAIPRATVLLRVPTVAAE